MGYQEVAITNGCYSFFTVTFKNIEGGEFDIQDIIVTSNGTPYTVDNKVKVQKVKANGDYDQQYNWRPSRGGWCRLSTYLGRNNVMLADGEGLCVYNGDSMILSFRCSGEVNIEPMSTEVPVSCYKFIGNMTPCKVDIQDVIPYIGESAATADNAIKIQKIKGNGDYDQQWNWRPSRGGWCRLSTFLGRDKIYLEPGEGLCVYNGEKNDAIALKFPSPISK